MNDARNKLRSMGGIMASSPQLMQAATQRFQAGGLAMTTSPMAPVRPAMQYNDIMRPQMEPPVVGLGRVAPVRPAGLPDRLPTGLASFSMQDWRKMNRKERKAAGLPVSELGAQLFFDRFGVGLGLVEPDARYTSEGPVETEAERLMAQSRSEFFLPQFDPESELSKLLEQERAEEEAKDVAGAQRIQRRKQETIKDLEAQLERAPDVRKPAIQRRIDELQGDLTTGQTTGTPLTMDEVTLPPQPAGVDDDKKAAATEQRFKDLVPKGAQEDPAEAEKIAQDAMSVLLKTQQPTGGGEEDSAKSLEDYYKDARALISKVYGEEDDGVDNRMMDLAMIGLAIAAGQSPNALSNIAQGLLVGTQGMAQRREAERERERGLRTLALETAIAQQGAATEAEAEAARMDVEQQNRLELEREKARLQGAGGDGKMFSVAPTVAQQAVETENKIRTEIPAGGLTVPDQFKDNQEAFIVNEKNKRMLSYIEDLGIQKRITDPLTYARLGQKYMYQQPDPADPTGPPLPVVRSTRELGFILPGQSYLSYDPKTGESTRKTKPRSE